MVRAALIAVIVIMLSACAGTHFSWEDTEKITNGMTESQVVAILGAPYLRSQSGNTSKLVWSWATAFGGARAVGYTFVDGKVVGQSTVGK